MTSDGNLKEIIRLMRAELHNDPGVDRFGYVNDEEIKRVLDAADLLCRLERRIEERRRARYGFAPGATELEQEIEAARREQAREGGSDGR